MEAAVVVAFTAVAEVVAFTVVAEEAAISAVEAATLEAEHPAPALVGVDGPLARALFAGVLLALMARTGQAGRELTAIDLTVRDRMGCIGAGAQLPLVPVTAQCRGTELIQG